MAQKVVTELVDDLNGGEADQTVVFAWQGYTYEIDLSEKNVAKLDKALAPFVANARRLGRAPKPTTRTTTRAPSDAAAVRAWAIANGYDVPAKGRIPGEIRDAFTTANG